MRAPSYLPECGSSAPGQTGPTWTPGTPTPGFPGTPVPGSCGDSDDVLSLGSIQAAINFVKHSAVARSPLSGQSENEEPWVGDGPAPSFMIKPPNTPLPESKNDGDTT